jgi:hypothetical protein
MVVQGDQREPVSAWNPCFTGKIQGIFEDSAAICSYEPKLPHRISRLATFSLLTGTGNFER